MTGRDWSRVGCAVFFVAAGVMHFVIPAFYLAMMPPWVPAHALMVQVSGVAEIAGGVGLLVPALRRAAGIGLILLLLAVFPANIQMLLNARAAGSPELALWLRLPLQVVFLWWVNRVGRQPTTTRASAARAPSG